MRRKYLVALLVLIVLIPFTILAALYYEAGKRLDDVTYTALVYANEALISLRDVPIILQKVRQDLEQYNYSPALFRRMKPDIAMYDYFVLFVNSMRLESLRAHLYTAYKASGLQMPVNLTIEISRMADYFQDLSQEYYSAMIGGKPFRCEMIPDNTTLTSLKEAIDKTYEEISQLLQDKEEFKGLTHDTIQMILKVGVTLEKTKAG